MLHLLLQPFVKKTKSYLKDSLQLVSELNKLVINEQYDYYSYDIKDLYLELILEDVLNILTQFMTNKLDTNIITITGFRGILKLVLFNNFFTFDNEFYLQIKGIAMGCIAAPDIANLFLSVLEEKFLNSYKLSIFYYRRFIDDLLVMVKKGFKIRRLFRFFGNLQLILSCKNGIVNFLDVNISLDYTYNRIKVSLYIKPTQNFSFLLYNSNHPNFIFENSPKSVLLRVRRNCSDLTDYLYFSNIYCYYYCKRGYSFINFCKISNSIAKLDRQKLLIYKEKKKKYYPSFSMHGKSVFDKNLTNLNSIITNNFNTVKQDQYYQSIRHFSLQLHNSMQPNISSMLIHNIYSFNFKLINHKYKICNNINCKVCSFAAKSNTIKLKNKSVLPILCSSSCDTSNFVYIIKCKLCNCFYIGISTLSVKDRISQHINGINYHIPYEKYNNCCVPNHFNLVDHNIKHFSFYVYTKDLFETDLIHFEAKLIYLFSNIFNEKILNIKTPFPYNMFN